jgi:hypothetical protein
MGRWRLCASLVATLAATLAWASAGSGPVQSASPISLQRDGALSIAGRALRCSGVRNVLDPRLPNLGIAARGVVVLNPGLLERHSEIVRLFVFHHECGHHRVGASELKADCWAVKEGVKGGWLDRGGLAEACRSFGNAPKTRTHPSGAQRCANLDLCFAAASSALAKQQQSRGTLATGSVHNHGPKLVSGPTLVRSGAVR